MTADLPDSPTSTFAERRIFDSNIAVAENSIAIRHFVELNIKQRFNPGLTKQNKVMPNCQISTLSKSSRFAYLM